MVKRAKTPTQDKQYKVNNWTEYNKSLVNRGDFTLWLDEDVLVDWEHGNDHPKVGRPYLYSDSAILSLLSLREVFHLTYRQTEGFGRALVRVMKVDVEIPDYSSLQKRASKLDVDLDVTATTNGARDIVLDSTGLKVYGEGEWKARQHGASKRRTWRKLHVGIDPSTGEILIEDLTENDVHDGDVVKEMLDQVEDHVERFFGDGAYDQRKVYDVLEHRGSKAIIPPRRNAKLWQHGNSSKPKHPRDENLRAIGRSSRRSWKISVGYHLRSLGETVMYRLKTVFGGKLKNRKLHNQKIETRIRCRILNKFTTLGTPDFVWS